MALSIELAQGQGGAGAHRLGLALPATSGLARHAVAGAFVLISGAFF